MSTDYTAPIANQAQVLDGAGILLARYAGLAMREWCHLQLLYRFDNNRVAAARRRTTRQQVVDYLLEQK